MEDFQFYVEYVAKFVECIGVAIILFGVLYSLGKFLIGFRKPESMTYSQLRHLLGKFILVGLEVLIAADIMATVVTKPTLRSVVILGLIVLIRTFLSISIEAELKGKLPWMRDKSE